MDIPPKKFGRRYPWHKWLGRKNRTLTLYRGHDYNGRTDTFIQRLHWAAHPDRYDVGLDIEVSGDGNMISIYVRKKHRGRGRPAGNGSR